MNVRRGEIYWVDFDPPRGSEQGGVRAALGVQNDLGNQHSTTPELAALLDTPPASFAPSGGPAVARASGCSRRRRPARPARPRRGALRGSPPFPLLLVVLCFLGWRSFP